jgi:isocitrate dehydrogenase
MALSMLTNRGVKVWPNGHPATFCTDHWRARFKSLSLETSQSADVLDILTQLHGLGLDVVKTENLYTFDGEPGFTLGQGQ